MRNTDPILDALNRLVSAGVRRGSLSIGGRQLRWVETAIAATSGAPTVVLEAGRNDCSLAWAAVIARLSQAHIHAIAYDRAGLGCSDPAPGEAVLRRQVDDLVRLIESAAQGSCLLVGHSWGGILAQALAFERPDLVTGLVLVDPAHEQMLGTLPPFARAAVRAFPRYVQPGLSALGIMRLIQGQAARQQARQWTEDQHTRDLVIRAYRSCMGRRDELRGAADAPAMLRRLRAASQPFPALPVIVLSASRGGPRQVRAHWTALQANLAAMAPQGKHRVVADVDHAIPQKRPDQVVEAIFEVMAAQRQDQGT